MAINKALVLKKNYKIFEDLERIAAIIPFPLYWSDINFAILGANDVILKAVGGSRSNIIGKTPYDYYKPEVAEAIMQNCKQVLKTKTVVYHDEYINDITTGEIKYFTGIRGPIFDDDGNVIGVIGTSIEVTALKEAEKLKLKHENDILEFDKKNRLIEKERQGKFKKIVDQVIHDIRSPIATMQMVLPHCEINPEHARVTLNQSAIKIQDIANQLLVRFKTQKDVNFDSKPKRIPTLLSVDILEIVSEKKYEYSKLSLDFIPRITQTGYFAFINVDITAFRRMMSNLINNAVDAVKDNLGEIIVHLDTSDNAVKIIIEDNGCGMPEAVKEKILSNITVTEGKADGHGIGFGQIRDTIAANAGSLAIESKLGQGTQIILTFPVAATPDWMCNKIELKIDDLVIILDDEPSIHGAWEARFKKDAPNITLKHFEQGAEAVEFINSLSSIKKDQIFLLTDYELLKQNLHGLEVVNKTKVTRSILVTSHHNSETVRNLAKESNTKILPKLLASEVKITVADAGPSAE